MFVSYKKYNDVRKELAWRRDENARLRERQIEADALLRELKKKARLASGSRRARLSTGDAGEKEMAEAIRALAVPESNPVLQAVLRVMDGQSAELQKDAAEQGIDPAESMARCRAADALRESADEIWQLVKQANAERARDASGADSDAMDKGEDG